MKTLCKTIIFVLMLSGCQTLDGLKNVGSSKPEPEPTEATVVVPGPTSLDKGERTLTALAGAAIPEGECGMVLWTLDSQRPVPVFRFVGGSGALISLDNAMVALQRSDYDGVGGFGVYESQTFSDGEQISVQVNARFGLEFEGGAYLERGVLKISDADGWSIVAPAAGIAGCRE